MKAHFNNLLDQQKVKVQSLESQVSNAKLTYAEALRNLEQISDEIHQSRSRASQALSEVKLSQGHSPESNDSYDIRDDFKSLPSKLSSFASPVQMNLDDVEGYKSVSLDSNISPMSPSSLSEKSEKILNPSITQSHSSEWTEINLDVSSPEDEDIPYKKLDAPDKPKLTKQKTLPNPQIENEYSCIRSKMKLDASISNWISRSSVKQEASAVGGSKQALRRATKNTSDCLLILQAGDRVSTTSSGRPARKSKKSSLKA